MTARDPRARTFCHSDAGPREARQPSRMRRVSPSDPPPSSWVWSAIRLDHETSRPRRLGVEAHIPIAGLTGLQQPVVLLGDCDRDLELDAIHELVAFGHRFDVLGRELSFGRDEGHERRNRRPSTESIQDDARLIAYLQLAGHIRAEKYRH